MIESFLEKKSNVFRGHGVSIIAIGSLVEGTRVGLVDEADCFIKLEKWEADHFELVENSSTKYGVTEAGKTVLPPQFVDEEGHLNYFNFLEALLTDLSRFFQEETLPEGITANANFCMCNNCRKEEGPMGHLKHCETCLPAVTFTKAGPCSIMDDEGTVISIDLIPMIPCKSPDPIKMFNKVTSSLIKANLPNWLPYLKKFVRSDGLLAEVLGSPPSNEDGFTAMKLLHAESDQDNYILRPGQKLAMDELKEPKLKTSYCYHKALKTIMTLDLSSFSLKKVLLLEDFTRQARTAKDDVEILFAASNHAHLKSFFENKEFEGKVDYWRRGKLKIDFPEWQKKMDEFAQKTKEEREKEDSDYKRIPLKWIK